MSQNTKYMELYRKFESLVRANGFESVKSYEDGLSDTQKQGKIRICRVIRNFIEHENPSFIEVSTNMIDFIQ